MAGEPTGRDCDPTSNTKIGNQKFLGDEKPAR